jgi:hypothetical protein
MSLNAHECARSNEDNPVAPRTDKMAAWLA